MFSAGDKIQLHGKLYQNSQTKCGVVRDGEWYIYDGKIVFGRYRVTNIKSRVQKYPLSVNVSGYVNIGDIELANREPLPSEE